MSTEANNVNSRQTWETAFDDKGPNRPDEVIPGLYISNIKTAGAYILGKVPDNFPRVSHIVSILSESSKSTAKVMYRLPRYPECPPVPSTSTSRPRRRTLLPSALNSGPPVFIAEKDNNENDSREEDEGQEDDDDGSNQPPFNHLLIHESDYSTKNLIKHFDVTNAFIHAALSTFNDDTTDDAQHLQNKNRKSGEGGDITQDPKGKGRERERQGGVLVHCFAGVSRSATIIIAYILKHRSDVLCPHPTPLPPQLDDPASSESLANLGDLSLCLTSTPQGATARVGRAIHYLRLKRRFISPNSGFVQQLELYTGVLDCSLTDPVTGVEKEAWRNWKRSRESSTATSSATRTSSDSGSGGSGVGCCGLRLRRRDEDVLF